MKLGGWATATQNNGIFVAVGPPAAGLMAVRKVNGQSIVNSAAGSTITIDNDPYDSPDAIVVQGNAGATGEITGQITAASVQFDFDYDNNTQGGRSAATPAAVVLVAAGLETAQVAVVSGLTITQSTGLTFSLTSPLERNYNNP